MNAPRLPLSMIPCSAKANVRTVLSADAWQAVANEAKARAGHRCEACFTKDLPLESHEFFSFSGGVQRLDRIAALCAADPASGLLGCHNVTHAGRSLRLGGGQLAEPIVRRLMEVNGWDSREATIAYIQAEFALVRARGRQTWRLDLELLREFGIEPRDIFPTRPLGTSRWRRLVGAA